MDHGILTEDAAEFLCHRLFSADLVLRSPRLIEKSGVKELTDILIIIDDTILIFQTKSLLMDIEKLDNTKLGRIAKRYLNAKKQINTTLNAHERNAEVHAVTPLEVEFTVDWEHIRQKVAIVTINIPDEFYNDPELRFQFPARVEKYKDIFVHTFLLADLDQAQRELTTPGDFLNYLSVREKVFIENRVFIGNELDFLAFYKTRYPELETALKDRTLNMMFEPGIWEGYRVVEKKQIIEREHRFKNSILIDRLIRELRRSVEYSAEKYNLSVQQSAWQYLMMIGKLGKLTRIERAEIGNRLLTKVEKTKTSDYGYFVYMSQITRTAYLFLLMNEPDRKRRKSFLEYLCSQACHLTNCHDLLGIVTEGAQQKGNSIDAILMYGDETRENIPFYNDYPMFKDPVLGQIDEWNS
jgi:hypothetical protein